MTPEIIECRCWGVVSSWAADSFYDNLTYDEALQVAQREAKEPGRQATIVLIIKKFENEANQNESDASNLMTRQETSEEKENEANQTEKLASK